MTKSVKAEIGQDRAPDSSASTRSLGRRSASTGRTDALFPRLGGLRAQRLEVARGSQSGSRPAAASSPSETLVFRIAGRNQQCRAPVSADACSPMRQAPSTSTVTPWSRDGGAGVQPPPPANHAARSIEECGSSPGTTGGGFVAVPWFWLARRRCGPPSNLRPSGPRPNWRPDRRLPAFGLGNGLFVRHRFSVQQDWLPTRV